MLRPTAMVLATILGVGGCGIKDRTVARLELADAKLTIDQPDGVHHELTLAASGAVAWDGKPLVTVGKSGVLRAGGKVVAKVDKYGAITIRGQLVDNVAVRPDGTFELDGEAGLTIDRDGTVAGSLIQSLDHPALVLEGSKLHYTGPPAARWALLLGFAALVTPDLASPAPP